MNKLQIISKNEIETAKIAAMIAPYFHVGDIILLDGDLGTGKTQFVKSFTSTLGSINKVTSPTFTIAHFYDINEGSILHIDAYRLSGIHEFRDTGLFDFFSQSIVLIEWGTKIIHDFDDYIHINFEHVRSNKKHRKITFSYTGDKLIAQFQLLSQKLSNL